LVTTFIYGKPRSRDIINTYINPEAEMLAAKALWVMILMAPVSSGGKTCSAGAQPAGTKTPR